jgi:hypothetical protein
VYRHAEPKLAVHLPVQLQALLTLVMGLHMIETPGWMPVHTYLFAERGVSIIEVMWLEDLAKDQVYEFAFLATSLKLRGATGRRSGRWRSPLSGKDSARLMELFWTVSRSIAYSGNH